METGGYMPVELPFKLQIDFIVEKGQFLKPEILKTILDEICDIAPVPEFTISVNTIEEYQQAKELSQNYNIDVVYNINYSKNLEITDANIVLSLNTPELYQVIKKYSNKNCKIILNPSQNMPESALKELDLIKSDSNLKDVYLQPYLTEKEIQNFSEKRLNREFLTCAAPWLTPIIDAEGNVFCCKVNKIGNIQNASVLDLWNTNSAQAVRDNLACNKNFDNCKQCLKKYTNAFVIADNAEFEYKQNRYKFPSVINYVQSAPKIALVKEKAEDCEYQVFPCPVFGDIEKIPQDIKENILILLE